MRSLHWFALAVLMTATAGRAALVPLPQGQGLAAGYPGDKGLENDRNVLFVESFESYVSGRISWSEIGGWDNVYGTMVITRTGADVHSGRQALQISCTGTQEQSHGLVKQIAPQGALFVRWYMKFHTAFPGCHHAGLSIRGGRQGDLFTNPTGTRPDGSNFFWVCLDHLDPNHSWNPPGNTMPPGWVYNYCYHMNQSSQWGDVLLSSGDLNGRYPFSGDFVPRANVTPPLGRWVCCELMVENNTPGAADGRVAVWIDGSLVLDHPGLRFRSIEEIAPRFVNLSVYASQVRPHQTMWYDDVVVAKQYIGPMAASAIRVRSPAGFRDREVLLNTYDIRGVRVHSSWEDRPSRVSLFAQKIRISSGLCVWVTEQGAAPHARKRIVVR